MQYTNARSDSLIGPALDWAVGLAVSHHIKIVDGRVENDYLGGDFNPSVNWCWGGPIMEKEGIFPVPTNYRGNDNTKFMAHPNTTVRPRAEACGPTPLIAAMRCLVMHLIGDTIDIPSELVAP